MAASNTDKWRKKKSNFSTTLSSSINDSDTTIPVNSVSGLPTDTAVTLTIDRVDSDGNALNTTERVTCVVSGGNLTNCTRGVDGTTAQAHSSGAVVEDIWSAASWNDAIDSFLIDHAQDGKHTQVTGDSLPMKVQAHYDDWVTATDGATVTFDVSSGQRQTVTLGGNRTIAFSNFTAGTVLVLELVQDATGSRTVTWPAEVKWAGGTAPTLSTGASDVDTIILIKKDASNIFGYELGLDMS